MPLAPDTRLGAYKLLAHLGQGAMGDVYRARDITLGREFAIRILPEEFARDPKRVASFREQVQALAAFRHPRVMGIYALTDSEETHFLVVEFISGGTLAERLKAGPLPVAYALPMAKEIGETLAAGHARKIIHGDLKPANIGFVANDRLKVLDFGLARAMESTTGPGTVLKTSAYMSPEHALGQATDQRADVWGFGCVLYEMLAGKPAFAPDGYAEPDWSALPADAPWLRTLISGCLQTDREQRIPDIPTALPLLNEPAPVPVAAPAPSLSGSTMVTARIPREPRGTVRPPAAPPLRAAPPQAPRAASTAPALPDFLERFKDWRSMAMAAAGVILLLVVGRYLLGGGDDAQPGPAPAAQVEEAAPPPAPEVTAAVPGPRAAAPAPEPERPPTLTPEALDLAISRFGVGSTTQGLQELDWLAQVSRYERSTRVPTDDERGLHRQVFLNRADRNLGVDPAKTEDSLRELIRIDPTYSPRLAAALQTRLDAVRSRDTGTLRISSSVAGSTIRVNGAVAGVFGVGPIVVRVMPGQVEVRAHHDAFPRDGATRVSVTAGATVTVPDIAPRRVVQPIVLVVDRLDADIYVRKASVDRPLSNLDPRARTSGTDVLLNNGVAQKPTRVSAWKAQVPAAAAAEFDRRLAATGLDASAAGVFVVPQDAIEYNRAIHVLFLKDCYQSVGKKIVLTEEFLSANEAAPLLWLDENSVARFTPDPLAATLPQCRALRP